MSSPPAILLCFALFCAGVILAARWLRRPLGGSETAFFLLLTLVFLFPGFFRGKTILPVDHAMLLAPWSHVGAGPRYNANLNDAVTQLAPWAKAVRMAWKEGSLPLRDRWNGSSMALAANGQSAPFSPFTFLTFPLALWAAFTLLAASKIFVALAGASLWLRELNVSRGSAAFGAVLFALSFSLSPWLLFPQSSVYALLPWALLAIELIRGDASRRQGLILLVAVFALWPLCGHPESVVVCAGFAAVWLAARMAMGDLPDGAKVAGRIALGASLAIGLTAFLTIPEALAIQASNRVRFAEAFCRALPASLIPHLPVFPGGLLTPLFPRTLGDAIDSPMLPGGGGNFMEMALGYFGVVGAATALVVLRRGSPRSRTALALIVPLVLGLAAASGTWPVYDVAIHLPVLRLMFVLRWLSWVAFAGAALAAFEADRLARDVRNRGRAALVPLASAAAIVALGFAAWRHYAPAHAAAGGSSSQRHALFVTVVAALAFSAACLASAWSPRLANVLPALLCLCAVGELLAQGTRIFRFDDPARLFPETPMIRFLRSQPGPFRASGDGAVLFPSSNVFAGIEDIRTHDPVEREDYVDFLDRSAGYPPSDYFKRIHDWSAPDLDLLNLVYLAGEPGQTFSGAKWSRVYDGSDGVVYRNADALPRVFAASRIPRGSRHEGDGFETSGYVERTNSIAFRVRAPAGPVPAVVSVVQDGGWSAADESGRPLPTSKAAGVLLGVELPEGDHTIRLRYVPPGFAAGCGLSAATALALAVIGAIRARTRPRLPRSRASGSD